MTQGRENVLALFKKVLEIEEKTGVYIGFSYNGNIAVDRGGINSIDYHVNNVLTSPLKFLGITTCDNTGSQYEHQLAALDKFAENYESEVYVEDESISTPES